MKMEGGGGGRKNPSEFVLRKHGGKDLKFHFPLLPYRLLFAEGH